MTICKLLATAALTCHCTIGGAAIPNCTNDQHDSLPLVQPRTAAPPIGNDSLPLMQPRTAAPHMKTNALMLGIGYTDMLDTYLSPEKYRGTEVRFISHTRRETTTSTLVKEITHEGSVAFADNRSGNGGEIAMGYALSYALLKKWKIDAWRRPVNILVGAAANLNIGMLYNTRNGNNPANARLSLHIEPTVAVDVPIGKPRHSKGIALGPGSCARFPVVLHYEAQAPLCGLMFSPNYGQSYYEIFSRGNYDHNCVPTTFVATPSLRQTLTVDFRWLHTTWRIGYLGDYKQAKVNNLKQHTYTHAVVIGVVRRL